MASKNPPPSNAPPGRTPPAGPPRGGQRYVPLLATFAMIGVAAIVYVAVTSVRSNPEGTARRPFDPQTTNPDELRRVTEAVSRIISASPAQHAIAVATLESVRADSAGARDLKESCVNTYRGMIRAEDYQRELRGILGAADGGEVAPARVSATDRARGEELFRLANEQIELVHQSRDRCLDLYMAAVRTMRITPARRWPH